MHTRLAVNLHWWWKKRCVPVIIKQCCLCVDGSNASEPQPKPGLQTQKVMLCTWWDCNGDICFELLSTKKIITADMCCQQLDRSANAPTENRQSHGPVQSLHENAHHYTAMVIGQKLLDPYWEVLPPPTIQLIPCTHWLPYFYLLLECH